jgi:ADP-heptose:LPS heptosyltransferase
MNDSKIIRWTDKYVGTLICHLFNFLHIFKIRRKTGPVKNVLIIELFEMGAAVMAYSSIKHIIKNLNAVNIYCLSTKQIRETWELLNLVPSENIMSIDDRNLFAFIKSLIKQVIYLRKKKIDLVIDFELFMRISSIISFLVGARLKAGFYKYGLEGLSRGNYDFKCCYSQNAHISKNFLALTKTAVTQAKEIPNYKGHIETSEIITPVYESDPEMKIKVKAEIKMLYPDYTDNDIILICPDVGKILSVRNYPSEYFVEVINELLNHYSNYLVLLIGVEENYPVCSFIKNQTNNPRCINFCGKTRSIRELFELMTISKLLIGNDNGPLHFASMTGMKILALFSTDSPFVYGPLGKCVIVYSHYHCSPCINAFNHKSSQCRESLCLKTIEPQRIIDFSIGFELTPENCTIAD